MQQLHQVEEVDSTIPIICLFASPSQFILSLVKQWLPQFKVIFISDRSLSQLETEANFYFIKSDDITLVSKLQEKINYSVIFMQNITDKIFVDELSKKLINDNARSLVIFPALQFEEFSDIVLSLKNEDNFLFASIGEFLDEKDDEKSTEFLKIIKNIISDHKAVLKGNDLYPIYPITYTDCILFINKLLFTKTDPRRFTYLYYKSPETLLSAIHLINRVIPDTQISFADQEIENEKRINHEEIHTIVTNKLQMEEQYLDEYGSGFENSISQLINSKDVLSPLESINKKELKKDKKKKKFSLKLPFALPILGGGILLFILIQIIFLVTGILALKSSIHAFENKSYTIAASKARIARFFLNGVKDSMHVGTIALSPIDREGKLFETYTLVKRSLELVDLAGNTAEDFKNIGKNGSETKLENIITHTTFLYTEGQRIKKEQNNSALNNLLTDDQSKIMSLSPFIPLFFGFDKEKNYLILFQNNGELRPTGGFIGSIGELSINKGKIKNLNIQDVYDFDGQLKTHVEPPFIVRRFLQPHLYLRDSNFYPDFQESASKAALLYNLETDKKPDGIIAIDFEVLKRILKIVGNIKIPSYDSEINDTNVFDVIENSIEKNKFPGSTEKKNILHDIYTTVLLKLEQNPELWIKIGLLTPKILDEKHALIAMGDLSLQEIFNSNNFGGELKDVRIRNADGIYDFLAINEANIGVNKANSKVNREIEYTTHFSEKSLESKVTIRLKNDFREKYRSYIRIFAPLGSKFEKITIDGVEKKKIPAITDPKFYESRTFKSDPSQFEVEENDSNKLRMFGFITEVPNSSTQTIEVFYSNGSFKSLTPLNLYSLNYIKQPGTLDYPFTLTLTYPEGYAPLKTNAQSFGKGFLKFEDLLTTDKEYTAQIQRK